MELAVAGRSSLSFSDLYEYAPVGYITLDRDGQICAVNLSGANLLEMERSQLIGRKFERLVRKDSRPAFAAMLRSIVERHVRGECQVTLLGNGIEPLFVRLVGTWYEFGVHLTLTDQTELKRLEELLLLSEARYRADIKQADDNLSFLAQHDPLTKLLNRGTLRARIRHLLALARQAGIDVALMILNIDGFRHINSSTGRGVGDKLLQAMAQRLRDQARSCDLAARMGWDEFALILWGCGAAEASALARKLTSSEFTVEGVSFTINSSIGISVYPGDGTDHESLLKNADLAMRHAKKSGGGDFEFFTARLNRLAHEQFAIGAGLRLALNRNEFELYYQPKVHLGTGKLSGMEALIRWRHPVKGLTLPGNFIPVAEETGLLATISKWTIISACRQMRQWLRQGIGPVSVAVNLSASFFQHRDFEDTIESSLQETGVPPDCLELELTEATLMDNPERALGNMAAMKALGLMLSIDDFGIGYSSLSYLRRLPIDKLKIDRSFVRNISGDDQNAAVVRAIINIGHTMQQRVIAEGVESGSELGWLRSEGCDEVQGYYLSRPLPAQGMTTLLKQGANFLHNPRGKQQARHAPV